MEDRCAYQILSKSGSARGKWIDRTNARCWVRDTKNGSAALSTFYKDCARNAPTTATKTPKMAKQVNKCPGENELFCEFVETVEEGPAPGSFLEGVAVATGNLTTFANTSGPMSCWRFNSGNWWQAREK